MKLNRIFFWVILELCGALAPQSAVAQDRRDLRPAFDEGRAGFAIRLNDLECPYRVMGVYVLPQDTLLIAVNDADRTGSYGFSARSGRLDTVGTVSWRWHAPRESGLYRLTVRSTAPRDSIMLNIFVMVPASEVKNGSLGGYRIGEYPKKPYRGLDNYTPPKGFIKVTATNQYTHLSPHFHLNQFLCKQAGGFPKYIVLREELLLKLELILREVNQRGYRCDGFSILSGYRTPYYNKSIGNVKYSRHQWGGAADIFIDEAPADDTMDDLNNDGAVNWKDAAVLYDIIDDLYGKLAYEPFVGGLGRYRTTNNHGPFVHIDVRGFRARWGE